MRKLLATLAAVLVSVAPALADPTTKLKGNLSLTGAATFSAVPTFPSGGIKLKDSAGDHTTTIKQNSNEAADRTLNVPALGANADIVVTVGAQSVGGVKTFTAQPIFKAGVTNADGIRLDGATNDAVIVGADQAAERIYTVPDAGGNASFVMTAGNQTIAGTKTFSSAPAVPDGSFTRSALVQEDLADYPIDLEAQVRTDNGLVLDATGGAALFKIVSGAWSTGGLELRGNDASSSTITSTGQFIFTLPPEYVAGETVTVRIRANLTGGGAFTTQTIDVEAWELDANGGPAGDRCATAAQNLVAATPTNFDFTITPTTLAPGDRLQIKFRTVVAESGTAASRAVINAISVLADIKG